MRNLSDSDQTGATSKWRLPLLPALLVSVLIAITVLLSDNEPLREPIAGETRQDTAPTDSGKSPEMPGAARLSSADGLPAPQEVDGYQADIAADDILKKVVALLDKSTPLDGRRLSEMSAIAGDSSLSQEERIDAIYWLAQLGSDAAIDVLVKLLASDDDAEIRDGVVQALGESPNPATTQILLGLLDDPDPVLVLSAIEGLAGRRDAAVRRNLLEIVVDVGRADEIRAAAAAALGAHAGAVSDLLFALEGSPDALTAGLLNGLAQQPLAHSELIFRELLTDPHASFELKLEAIDALAAGSSDAVGLLLEVARDGDDPELRVAAVDALALADEVDAHLAGLGELALNESSAEVRASLYNALALYAGQANDPAVAAKLVINSLAETEPGTRLEGYRMVASMLNFAYQPEIASTFDNSMVPWLQSSAEFGEDRYARFISIDALRLANTVGSRTALDELQYSADPAVASAAQQALQLVEE